MAKSMKLGKGGRFQKLSGKIERQYVRKGYNVKQAEKIADATAAKIGAAKYGKKRMAGWARKGRK